ncbi:DDE family endonuclease [Mycena sanguinolenta]|uniref:DDE family endonuclease n=1 Tax=Mycena sanguinolenta TaxID=230812 RepID=A0A8H7CHL9_9AGAR|nr:DDE family endonuclease [Mycena sanguinolenta]
MPKGKPISVDLRWAIVRMHTLFPLDTLAAYTGFLHGCLDLSCDQYLDELQQTLAETCGRYVSLSTIWRALKRSGYTMMKLTRKAIERSALKRARYTFHVGLYYLPYQLVFVDESSCDRRTSYRGKAWAIIGQRAVRKAFFCARKTVYSVLPAISLDGILWVDIVEGSFNSESFEQFIDGLLDRMNPFPGPNSVIVMDNCKIHKGENIRQMIEARGMRCLYLPPYSPDYNPMEPGFSKMKAHMRREGHRFRSATESSDEKAAVLAELHKAVFSITPQDAQGWFRHSGYI